MLLRSLEPVVAHSQTRPVVAHFRLLLKLPTIYLLYISNKYYKMVMTYASYSKLNKLVDRDGVVTVNAGGCILSLYVDSRYIAVDDPAR